MERWRYDTDETAIRPTDTINLRRFVHPESEATVVGPPTKGDSIFTDGESIGGLKAHLSV
ncbi:hypothetical protein VNI00_019030 [Paramarasmius palmivorus]|uniref:Uncharacterized protein n=1 Tax=Paramarasmius palmivorus TaxID=297713 RepID=A0AAW0AS88_9AGAR